MYRNLCSSAAASALALLALTGLLSQARAEPDARAPARTTPSPPGVEVQRGSERSVVPLDANGRAAEDGVLGIRGTQHGASRAVRSPLEALPRPARAELHAQLEAIGRIYTEVLQLNPGPELEDTLAAVEPDAQGRRAETLRATHRHALEPGSSALTPGRALAERTRHETSHAWVHALAPDAPRWLDEGLACYFEGLELQADGSVRVAASARRHGTLRTASRAGTLPGLARLFELGAPDLAREPAAVASWALVFSLMGRSAGQSALRELLRGATPGAGRARLAALGLDDPTALPRSWRRTPSGGVADHLALAAPRPSEVEPEPTELEETEESYAYADRFVRRPLRCVRGVIGAGTPNARPALFCSRVRERRVRVER